MEKELIYVSCSPDTAYYAWQVEVMLHNFRRLGVPMGNVHILAAKTWDKPVGKEFEGLKEENPDVKFFFYEDKRSEVILTMENNKRADKKLPQQYGLYIPSIVFHLMGQHYREQAWVADHPVFHHDNDMIFKKLPDFERLLRAERCWASDCKGYIGVDYIESKGDFYVEAMARIVGIPAKMIYDNRANAGGAQYIIRGVDYLFWQKVERDSVALYQFFTDVEAHAKSLKKGVTVIQKWTAGMWALLYNLYANTETGMWIDDTLGFSFATADIKEYNERNILHNAGVTAENKKELFLKSEFMNKHPFNEDLSYVRINSASYFYAKEVTDCGEKLKANGGLKKYE